MSISINRKLKVNSVDSHLEMRHSSMHNTRIQTHTFSLSLFLSVLHAHAQTHAHSLTISWSSPFHVREEYGVNVSRLYRMRLAAHCLRKNPSGIHKVSLKIFRSQANNPMGLDYHLEGLELLSLLLILLKMSYRVR